MAKQATATSSETITWLHISDLHFRAPTDPGNELDVYNANVVLQALLRDIAERIDRDGLQPDLIVVTGDIGFAGKSAEYDFAQRFFNDLLAIAQLPRNRLFIVPGNHDVDRGLISQGARSIGDSLNDRDGVNAVLSSPVDRKLMFDRFGGYASFVNTYLNRHLSFDEKDYFYVRKLNVGERPIALLGLNSAWTSASEEDEAKRLVVGERQARTALDKAETASAVLKIALLHHPLDLLRSFDRNDVEPLLCDNCHFVLHGHLHQAGMAQLVGPDSGAMIIGGGACYATRQYPNSYNLVQLNLSSGTGSVYLRRYSDARGGFWAKDTLTYRNAPDGVYNFPLPKSLTTLKQAVLEQHDSSVTHTHLDTPGRRPNGTARAKMPAQEITWEKDGKQMVFVTEGNFYVDKFPVTREEYRRFAQETLHPIPWQPIKAERLVARLGPRRPGSTVWDADLIERHLPATNVTLDEAMAYAGWAGKRLPAVEEWQQAARSGCADKSCPYPWGDALLADRCNTRESGWQQLLPVLMSEAWEGANPAGVCDIVGNAAEWATGNTAAGSICGGSYRDPAQACQIQRVTRAPAGWHNRDLGFRCIATRQDVFAEQQEPTMEEV